MGESPRFDAIILAGGSARRLGGADKALVSVGSSTLLERVIAALAEAQQKICVGPKRTGHADIIWTQEDPPGGGPVAALAAGLERATAPVIVLVAVDLPFITPQVVARLVKACSTADTALVVDEAGTPQPLLAAYRSAALRRRLQRLPTTNGISMKHLLEGISQALLHEPDVAHDCDTWGDVERARAVGGSG